ncbi:MAG TPA: hypothetical protein PKN21_00955, partial [Bacteroidales bacterium]|nr:hypothetical protein [Bacteroidales bacterium]
MPVVPLTLYAVFRCKSRLRHPYPPNSSSGRYLPTSTEAISRNEMNRIFLISGGNLYLIPSDQISVTSTPLIIIENIIPTTTVVIIPLQSKPLSLIGVSP